MMQPEFQIRPTSLLGVFLFVCTLLVSSTAAAEDGPIHVPLQGLLTETDGTPLDGDVEIAFRIYADGQSQEVLWESSKTVAVDRGLFTTYLGTEAELNSSLFHADPQAMLSMQIAGDEESPRIRLGFSPLAGHALSAATADDAQTLQGLTPTDIAATSAAEIPYDDTQGSLNADNTQDALDALLQRVEALEASKTALENRVNTLENNSVAQDITDLQSRVATVETSVSTLNTDVTSNTQDVSGLQARVTAVENSVTTFSSQISANATDISAIDGRVTTVESNLSSLGTTVNDHDTTLTNHDSRLTSIESSITSHDQRLASLETKTSSMDAQVIGGRDAVVFTGVNVHVRSGAGATDGDGTNEVNGLGNLVIGYDEVRTAGSDKTGSHNLVLGEFNNYSSYGGIVGGFQNSVSNHYASVISGRYNEASARFASVMTGDYNQATGDYASITSGSSNDAIGIGSVVVSGSSNIASGGDSVIVAGSTNEATSTTSVVVSGFDNDSTGFRSVVGGGSGQAEARSYGFTADGLVSP